MLPFFLASLFFPELRALANRNAGLPCGHAGIAHGYSHGYSRRFTVTTFLFFVFRSLPLTQKKNLSFSKFFSFDFDETHDIMLATQHQYPSLFPAPGTGRGFFCMCPWDLMVRVPVLFGPGWQASGSEIPGLG